MGMFKDQINQESLPKHVAVIMDGNGRWAKKIGKARIFGHRNGVKAVRETAEAAAELGIEHLTLYAFSTENWNRPKLEVSALMMLLVDTLKKEINTLNKNNIKLHAIGDLTKLPKKTYKALMDGIESTKNNTRMTLHLALNYSSRWEIIEAAKKIAVLAKEGKLDPNNVDETEFDKHLATAGIPDPELLIRTSGERRLSNYLLYQLAYTELYFTDNYWPEFRKVDFYKALIDFQMRERRFGMTSDQIS